MPACIAHSARVMGEDIRRQSQTVGQVTQVQGRIHLRGPCQERAGNSWRACLQAQHQSINPNRKNVRTINPKRNAQRRDSRGIRSRNRRSRKPYRPRDQGHIQGRDLLARQGEGGRAVWHIGPTPLKGPYNQGLRGRWRSSPIFSCFF